MSSQEDIIFINAEEADTRLDRILTDRFKESHSRSYFQFLIREGSVLLNGEPVKKHVRPKEGDEVQIQFILTPEIKVEPEEIPLDIIYEDDAIIVVNKQPGLVVHPAPGNWNGTFVNALLYHCKKIDSSDSLRPGIVHRLDKDTSGLLVAAKSMQAHQKLIELFSKRDVEKEYLVLTVGNPGDRTIDAPIGRHPVRRKEMAVNSEGRSARTHCKVIDKQEMLCLVQCTLETGRTHQIRVHLKHVNAPILGDSVYGSPGVNKRYGAKRQMLHAWRLAFNHPVTGQPLTFCAEPPEDFQERANRYQLKVPPCD